MNTRLTAAPLAVLACLLASACGGITIQTDTDKNTPERTVVEQNSPPTTAPQSTPTDFATPSPATVTVTAPATSNPDPDPGNGDLPAKTCPNNSLEGCFTYDEMQPYINAVLPTIEQFLEAQYKAMPLPDHIWFVEAGTKGETACTATDGSPAPYTSLSFLYCPADKSIYTGQDSLWTYYRTMGDAAPAVAIAHEYGHHIQLMVEVPEPTTNEESINHENQADCIAGAYAGFANDQGWLEKDDISDIDALLDDIADSEDDPNRSHGVLKERSDAFITGFRNGLTACNAYHADVPIIQ